MNIAGNNMISRNTKVSPTKTTLKKIIVVLFLSCGFLASFEGISYADPTNMKQQTIDTSIFNDAQKRGIEQTIKEYLLKNPELIIEIQNALESKMAKEEEERTKKIVSENAKEIYRHPNSPVAGNPNGDITVVEFFDYNCGYCKRGFHNILEVIQKDPKIRIVFNELPILSKDSEEASKVALAARAQGKYWELHKALIESKGRVTEATALEAASKLGLDVEKLKRDKDSDAVNDELTRVGALARKMNINGTPHFLIGSEAIGGAPENLVALLTNKVAELRKEGCGYC